MLFFFFFFFFFFFLRRGGGEGGRKQSQTNLPLQLLRSWGHNNALMYKLCKLCPWKAQFMTILSFDLQVWPWQSTYQPTNSFHKESKSKKKKTFFFRGGGGAVNGWTDEQAQTNLPLQLLRSWGHNNALMYKLCHWQAQFLTILSFYFQVWPWPTTYLNKCFEGNFYFSKTTTVQNYFAGRGRWMDRRTGPNQFAPSTSSKLGA